jgi:hypothetical protein
MVTSVSDHMPDQAFRLECRMTDVDVLINAGAKPDAFFSEASAMGMRYSVFETPDFSVLDRWRLVLNLEARPYRYSARLDGNTRKLGRSRSPEWA